MGLRVSSSLHLGQTQEVGQGLGKGGRTSEASFWVSTQEVAVLRAGQGPKQAYWYRALEASLPLLF